MIEEEGRGEHYTRMKERFAILERRTSQTFSAIPQEAPCSMGESDKSLNGTIKVIC